MRVCMNSSVEKIRAKLWERSLRSEPGEAVVGLVSGPFSEHPSHVFQEDSVRCWGCRKTS